MRAESTQHPFSFLLSNLIPPSLVPPSPFPSLLILLTNLLLSIPLLPFFIPFPSSSFLHSHSFFLILFPAPFNPFHSQSSLSIPYSSLFGHLHQVPIGLTQKTFILLYSIHGVRLITHFPL